MGVVNGDFESGQLGPWTPTGNPTSMPFVESFFVRSGRYALTIQGPADTSQGYASGVNQNISPVALPARVIGYMNSSLIPSCAQHPFNQFSVYGAQGQVVEFGMGHLASSALSFFTSENTTLTSPITSGWVKYQVDIYADHADFFVNDQKVGDTRSTTPNFRFPPSWGCSWLSAAMGKLTLMIFPANH